MIRSRRPAPERLQKAVAFEPGKAYYLGDFYAQATSSIEGRTVHWRWQVTNVVDDYGATTQKLKLGYPNLAMLDTENRMIGR
jgi:hypothetical protein